MLRDVVETDLPTFFEHQADRDAARMAAFTPREKGAFMAHWKKILADKTTRTQTIVEHGQVAGYVSCWMQDDKPLIAYWIGREHWGKGIATAALEKFLEAEARPVFAWVADANLASVRVLEKCGFRKESARVGDDGIAETLMKLA